MENYQTTARLFMSQLKNGQVTQDEYDRRMDSLEKRIINDRFVSADYSIRKLHERIKRIEKVVFPTTEEKEFEKPQSW